MEKFLAWLNAARACADGVDYVKRFSSPEDFWANCNVSEYMAWVVDTAGRANTATRVQVLVCMHEAILNKVTHAATDPRIAEHYASLVRGNFPAPHNYVISDCPGERLVQRFLASDTLSGWTYLYGVLGGDACALIRKHFPTIPLNLGE